MEAERLRSTIGSQMHAVLVRMGVMGGFSAVVIEDARHRAVRVASGPGGRAPAPGSVRRSISVGTDSSH
jgi:hypothetical protein